MTTPSDSREDRSPTEILRAYLELVRAPNIFTAMADVVMGFLFVNPVIAADQHLILALLVGASSCLYAAGMVLNDVFDVEIDRQERPGRPIPSGRVPLAVARRLGWGLLGAGVLLAMVAAALAGSITTRIVALLLTACIVFYDRILKRTPGGPLGMGACRMFNVLLGMGPAPAAVDGFFHFGPEHWLAAGAIGIYITGVTWLARGEAGVGKRWQLALATLVILAGFAGLFALPHLLESPAPILITAPQRWYLLIGILGAFTALRCFQTVAEPEPDVIQAAVKHCIMSIIFLDAAICCATANLQGAIVVLFFLIPTYLLGQWIYST